MLVTGDVDDADLERMHELGITIVGRARSRRVLNRRNELRNARAHRRGRAAWARCSRSCRRRFAPPIVIGEIAAGVAIGRTGTRTLDPNQPTLAFLAAIGFALLMFIVGTHIPIRDPRLRMAGKRGVDRGRRHGGDRRASSRPSLARVAELPSPVDHRACSSRPASAAIVLPIVQSEPATDALLVTMTWVTIARRRHGHRGSARARARRRGALDRSASHS